MSIRDLLGWAAAALTLLAFSCNDMLRLRYSALAANAAFIAYGLADQLWPVVALHLVLVPVNVWRLVQTCRTCTSNSHGAGTGHRIPEFGEPRRLGGAGAEQ
jgi:CRP/FNR family transcriptional regulator, cyclic AMP receptor protein